MGCECHEARHIAELTNLNYQLALADKLAKEVENDWEESNLGIGPEVATALKAYREARKG